MQRRRITLPDGRLLSRRHLQAITDPEPREESDLVLLLKLLLTGYDWLFNLPFPCMMVLHQRPSDDASYRHYHFHIEFYPPLRSANRLKYLAGSETGAGMFINDTLAEEKARELRALLEPASPPSERSS